MTSETQEAPTGTIPSHKDLRRMTGRECETFVKQNYPHAFMHGHGPECTVLAGHRADLPPQMYEQQQRYALSFTISIPSHRPESWRREKEDWLWRVAAAAVRQRLLAGTLWGILADHAR